ncbi:MAG: hypothetical protein CL932_03480 [Deltaproteobacteria bacterium]|nr:hypothetical protein [Deltaproteobacteria bacterium]
MCGTREQSPKHLSTYTKVGRFNIHQQQQLTQKDTTTAFSRKLQTFYRGCWVHWTFHLSGHIQQSSCSG